MRAVRLTRFGIDGLRVEEAPEPSAGPGELVLRVRSATLNHRDLLIVEGAYDPKLPLPLVPGSDAACEVVAVGSGVESIRVGERVCPIFARGWHSGPPTRETPQLGLGARVPGTLAELLVLRAEDVVRPPTFLSDAEAAALCCSALTAYRALFEHGSIGRESRVLVIGTGGVSTFAIQIASAAGADVTVVSRDRTKLERAVALGAKRGFCSSEMPEWGVAVRDATAGGVDHVVDVAGGSVLAQALRAVRAGGTISMLGTAERSEPTPSLLPAVMREVRLQGILVGPRSSFVALCDAVERWRVAPVVERTFPLADVRAAFEYLASDRLFGKIALEF